MTIEEKLKEVTGALNDVLRLIDQGKLVRNTVDDFSPNWAVGAIELIGVLKRAQEAVEL